jgi:16S rRNA (adenine1518-N6/adenine1519-N6)-dimethyltransferase
MSAIAPRDPRAFVDPRVVLGRHGLRPKRSFGQNFLVARAVVEKIAALCVTDGDCCVVEIGAGLGTLTSALLDRGARVTAIERDREMLPVLEQELASDLARGALTLVEADAATCELVGPFSSALGERVLAGNLPYQITGRLLERAIEVHEALLAQSPGAPRGLDRVVVMVQREVADRLIAKANGDAYGQLTVFVQAAFDVKRAFVVSPGSFHPAPEIESAVVVLTPLARPRARETETFRAVVHAAFGARRKTLRNAVKALIGDPTVADAVAKTGIDLGRRGETLTVEEFADIARAIDSAKTVAEID